MVTGAGTLQFSGSPLTVQEDVGNALITVTRTAGTTGIVTVNYATNTVGSATPGADFVAVSGVLTFADSEASRTIAVPIINDTTQEPTENIGLVLSAPAGGAILGTGANLVLIIAENDAPTPRRRNRDEGCSLGNGGMPDPTLPVMVGLAGLYLLRRGLFGKGPAA